jgi:cytidine deaminase
MYVTAFPCHLCARLIVAAGLRRVVYIEPYAKSLALQLYPDSITADYTDRTSSQISFEPFVGIAPRKYVELFTMRDRKQDDGKAIPFDRAKAIPRLVGSPRSYLAAETIAFAELEKVIQRKQLMNEQQELRNV